MNLFCYPCPLSVHDGCEQGSPPRLWCSDGRLSRSCSAENQHASLFGVGCVGGRGSDWPKKEAEENKENVRLDQCFSNTSGLPTDLDGWNESVISGGLKGFSIWSDKSESDEHVDTVYFSVVPMCFNLDVYIIHTERTAECVTALLKTASHFRDQSGFAATKTWLGI